MTEQAAEDRATSEIPDAQPRETPGDETQPKSPEAKPDETPQDRVFDPEKLLRIASLAREVLEECRRIDPDDSSADQLAALHKRVKVQLQSALPKVLADELDEVGLDLSLDDGATATEVRVAYSGLIGWLGGLFQGLQASAAQVMLQQQGQRELTGKPEDDRKEGYL